MSTFSILAVLLAQLLPAPTVGAPPGAYELLDRVRRAYEEVGSYRDRGEIQRIVRRDDHRQETRIRFETVAGEGCFRLLLETATAAQVQRRILWSDGRAAYSYDSGLGHYREVTSLVSEISQSVGEGSYDALVAAAMLAGGGQALLHPEGAAFEGEEPCGDSTCFLLLLSRMGAAVQTTLWIDRSTSLIRRAEVELAPLRFGKERRSQILRVRHEIESLNPQLDTRHCRAELPAGTLRVGQSQRAEPFPPDEERDEIVFTDEISVELTTIVARVVDRHGSPILGLTPEDFVVRQRGREVPVVAVDWVSSRRPSLTEPDPSRPPVSPSASEPPGSLLLFWIQADFNAIRVIGHLRLFRQIRPLLDSLHPNDLAGVVSFDSHLKLWQDFTTDRSRVETAIERAIRFGAPPHLRRTRPSPISLADHFDFRSAQRAATPEKALLITAEALEHLPGEKVLIYLGWGLGRFGAGGVSMRPDYRRAVAALERARTTVFVLDVTDADYHSLEVGLENVARHTGGTYAKTNLFAEQAAMRLARTIAGHYRLTVDRSSLPTADKIFDVELKEKRGVVLVSSR